MMKTRHIMFVFIPAILLVGVALFIRIVQYEPLFPKETENVDEQLHGLAIPLFADDPVIGQRNAPRTLVAFEDFGCPACRVQTELLEQLQQQYPGTVKIIWKGLPVTRFPYNTRLVHAYAFCANKQQQFDAFKDFAFANSDTLSTALIETIVGETNLDTEKTNDCMTSGLPEAYTQQIEQLASLLDIQSVPAIFFNNTQIQPPTTLEGWAVLLGLDQS